MGLSSYEAKSYLSLLERDILTVSQVSKIAGIPRTNAYEALEKLLIKGLCVSRLGNTKKYSASDPTLLKDKFLAGLDRATESQMANLTKRENEIIEKYNTAKEAKLLDLSKKEKEILEKNRLAKENINNIIKELKPQYERARTETNPLEYIQLIKDPFYINKKFMELCAKTNKEMVGFSKPPYSFGKERDPKQIEQQRKLSERGVKIRSIFEIPDSKEEKRWILENEKMAARHGHESRVLKELPMKMAIFDSRIVIFTLEDPLTKQPSLTSQIIEHGALAKSLKITFEALWEQAKGYNILKD